MAAAVLRLLADDLTGALDSAAAFATEAKPVAVLWSGPIPAGVAVAVASGTRERDAAAARDSVAPLADALWGELPAIAFKKIDSLLRGNEAAEIGAIAAGRRWERIVIAAAFPAQERVTRGGRQVVLREGTAPAPSDLAAALRSTGTPSGPPSTRCSCPNRDPATGPSWTTSRATRGRRSERPSMRPVPASSSSRPDVNPIENAFAKLEALLRKAAKRTVGALWDRIGILLDAVTPAGCANCF